jgi:hypothetical protein
MLGEPPSGRGKRGRIFGLNRNASARSLQNANGLTSRRQDDRALRGHEIEQLRGHEIGECRLC